MSPPTILVEAANGYIGLAITRAFVRAGWRVFSLIRRPFSTAALAALEAIPILSTLPDLIFIDELHKHTKTFDIIAVCAAPTNYAAYFPPMLAAVKRIAQTSAEHGVKPLVLWTSGSKDYGNTARDGDEGLAPHTEESLLDPLYFVRPRTEHSLQILQYPDLFDAAIIRPTNVIGYSSSIVGGVFAYFQGVADESLHSLELAIDPRTIMHFLHVDDCAEAYLALALHKDRGAVAGQCFNMSAARYETAESVLQALAKEYGIRNGVSFVNDASATANTPVSMQTLFHFSQWCSSDKIRKLTGWTDKRLMFSENTGVYRRAYEAAAAAGDEDVARNKLRLAALDALLGLAPTEGTTHELS